MRFFLYGTYIPADQLVAVARGAEACGFHGITSPTTSCTAHDTATPYPYAPDPKTGRAPWGETATGPTRWCPRARCSPPPSG